jgi:capsular exopolysaccharide synthesis family protein
MKQQRMMSADPTEVAAGEAWIEFERVLQTVYLGRKLIAVCAGALLIAAAMYARTLPNEFQAESKIMVEKVDRRTEAQQQDLLLPSLAAEEDFFGTQLAIITSNQVVRQVISELGMPADTEFDIVGSGAASGLISAVMPAKRYRVEVRRKKMSRIITVSVTGRGPKTAASIANKFAEVYVRQNSEQNLFVSKQMLNWITENDVAKSRGPEEETKRREAINSLAAVANDPVVQKLRTDMLELTDQLRQHSQRYKAKHPLMIELTSGLDQVKRELEDRTRIIVMNLKAALDGDLLITNVRVLDAASVPSSPAGPNRIFIMVVWSFLGAVGGVLVVLVREFADQTIKREEDLPSELMTPLIGAVPSIPTLDPKQSDPGSVSKTLYLDQLKNNLDLRDAIVGIRTQVLFSMPFEGAKSIMVTSAMSGEGKTTVTILLALSLAEVGKRILLIDTDLRRPSPHKYLGIDDGRGLSDYLNGSAELSDVIRQVSGTNLFVIPRGSAITDSSLLLASDRFGELMKRLGEEYYRVIVNVPPVLHNPDTLIVGKHVSCGLLICASRVATRRELVAVNTKFQLMNLPLMGIVINQLDRVREYDRRHKEHFDHYRNLYLKHTGPVARSKGGAPQVRESSIGKRN